MKNTFEQFAQWKKIDITAQCILFALTLVSLCFLSLFGLYIMALAQCVSSILWLHNHDVPQKESSKNLRRAIIGVCTLLLLLLVVYPGVFLMASFLMLLAGPVFGISYFVMTVKEQRYFANARKLYYQL